MNIISMPSDFKGKREEEVWGRIVNTHEHLTNKKSELVAAYCRAFVDEEEARSEVARARDGGDAAGARQYGQTVKDMREQQRRILASL